MKKKLMVFSMLLICMLTVAGCGKKEDAISVLTKAQENSNKVESATATATMDMKMSSEGQTISMGTIMDMTIFTKPYKGKINMTMDMGELGKSTTELYLMQEEDNFSTYTSMEGEWFKTNLKKQDFEKLLNSYNNSAYTDALLECKDALQMEEVEKDGKELYKVEGTITGEAMKKMIEATNLKDQLAATAQDISVYDNLGDLKLVSFVEKDSFNIYKVSIDMKNMMNTVMENAVKTAGTDMKPVKVEACTMNIKYTGYNNAKAFELPKEAEDAQELQQ